MPQAAGMEEGEVKGYWMHYGTFDTKAEAKRQYMKLTKDTLNEFDSPPLKARIIRETWYRVEYFEESK